MSFNIIRNSNQLSFLKARDPSIISRNAALPRVNLALNKFEDTAPVELEDNNIKIYLRLKKTDNVEELYKIEDDEIHCYLPTDSNNSKNRDGDSVLKKYKFSHIFTSTATQEEVFNLSVKPKIFKFINGENSTLMTYGASGSGKTFTIVGTAVQPGVIPRALEYLFRTLPELAQVPLIKPTQSGDVKILSEHSRHEEKIIRNDLLSMANAAINRQHVTTYKEMQQRLSTEPVGILEDLTDVILAIWVSFAEIYNESIFDLLTPTTKSSARPKLLLASVGEDTYIKNLTNVSVSSGLEAYQILQYGLHNLNYAATTINSHSSRSHCIFSIKIVQMVKTTRDYRINYFNFCDLAGFEKLKKTLNVGDRLKESNCINTSLLVLGRCISSIRESQKKNITKLVPFRESKLTRLFQRALTGYESIGMIVNMNPSTDMFDESQHVLNFSALAKDIVVRRKPIKPKIKNRFSDYIQMQPRSTAIPDIIEHPEESEISKLQDIIDELHCKIEQQAREYMEMDQKQREETVLEYRLLMQDMERQHEKNISDIKEHHRKCIELLEDKYENRDASCEIINLDSDSEDDDTLGKNQVKSLENELNDLKLEKVVLKDQLNDAKAKIFSQESEITELKNTLTDAAESYRQMEEEYLARLNELDAENMKLKESNSELSLQVEEYSQINSQNMENLFE